MTQTERIAYKLKHANWDSTDQKRKVYEELQLISWRLDDLEKSNARLRDQHSNK